MYFCVAKSGLCSHNLSFLVKNLKQEAGWFRAAGAIFPVNMILRLFYGAVIPLAAIRRNLDGTNKRK